MELTNAEIINSIEPLMILSKMSLPVLVSLQVVELRHKLNDPAIIVQDVYNKLVNTYGEKQESGEILVIGPDDLLRRPISPNWEKFATERNKLMSQTVELDVRKIELPTEIDGKPFQIVPDILLALRKLISIDGMEE